MVGGGGDTRAVEDVMIRVVGQATDLEQSLDIA